MDTKDIVGFGKEVIKLQSDSIKNLVDLIDENFENAIKLILDSKGRVVVTGIGKSAIIANKISQLIVTKENKYYGVLHIQNIIKEGIS